MKSLLCTIVALGLAACSTTSKRTAAGSGVPQKNATLIAGRSGAYIALQPKGALTVELQSNPAAGYHWKLAQPLDGSVLQLASTPASLPPIALAPTGPTTPQPEKWVFKAVGPGMQKVRMIYARPDQPLDQTVIYEFTVNAE